MKSLKAWLFIIALYTGNHLRAQNVGIGTTSPVNKLTVHGKVDIRDSLAIGHATPLGDLHVKSTGVSGPETLDIQSGTMPYAQEGGGTVWQSFTATANSLLHRVEFYMQSPNYPFRPAINITIRAGEGTNGTILSSTMSSIELLPDFQSFQLANDVPLVAGQVYTIILSHGYTNTTWIYGNRYNAYAGGRSSLNEGWDFIFKTYIIPLGPVDALVIDSATVKVNKLRMAGGAANGYILNTDAAGNANWVSPASVEADPKVGALTINKIPHWNGTTLVNGLLQDNGTYVEVNGLTRTTGIQITNTAAAGHILRSDAAGNGTWVNINSAGFNELDPKIGTNYVNYLPVWNGTQMVANTSFVHVDGDLGIGGFPDLDARFTVRGTASFQDSVRIGFAPTVGRLTISSYNFSNTPLADMVMSRHWGGSSDTRASAIFHYHNTTAPAADCMVFGVSGDGGSFGKPNAIAQAKMVIQASGNVGIGTITPAARLAVSSGATTGMRIESNANVLALSVGPNGEMGVDATGVVSGRFAIKQNGNIGVGTPSPITKLDVEGGIRTKHSGSIVLDVVGATLQTVAFPIAAVPADWHGANTVVVVTNADGVPGVVKQAKLLTTTSIELKVVQDGNGLVRYNWVIFRM